MNSELTVFCDGGRVTAGLVFSGGKRVGSGLERVVRARPRLESGPAWKYSERKGIDTSPTPYKHDKKNI